LIKLQIASLIIDNYNITLKTYRNRSITLFFNEINGLTGTFITVKGYFIEENQLMVLNINDLPIGRPPHPPPRHENEKDPMRGDGPGGL